MRYLGGKAKLAKKFLPLVLADREPSQFYVEPFLGGCNVLPHVSGPRIASDCNAELMALYLRVQRGDPIPENVSEWEYAHCKRRPDKHEAWERAFIGIGCSFGAKPWGGYARGINPNGVPRNYAAESARALESIRPSLDGVELHFCEYDMLTVPDRSIIYCDPPYAGTTGYGNGAFNHAKFWDWAYRMRAEGHKVFVSEYAAPSGWKCIWEHEHFNSVRKKDGCPRPVERIFTT